MQVYGNIIYTKNEYIIIKEHNDHIVYNTNKKWNNGHTHIVNKSGKGNSKKSAIDAITFVINKKIPKDATFRYLKSLTRISNDDEYINKINELIDTRMQKGKRQKIYKKNVNTM